MWCSAGIVGDVLVICERGKQDWVVLLSYVTVGVTAGDTASLKFGDGCSEW